MDSHAQEGPVVSRPTVSRGGDVPDVKEEVAEIISDDGIGLINRPHQGRPGGNNKAWTKIGHQFLGGAVVADAEGHHGLNKPPANC